VDHLASQGSLRYDPGPGLLFAVNAGSDTVSVFAGDERAFVTLVRRHHAVMLRLAAGYVPSMAVAEEVVQDTWLGMLRGIGGFEGRSSVRTWLFRILVNRARTAGVRERRSVAIGDWVPAGRPVAVRRHRAVGCPARALGGGGREPDRRG
jgi:DNA-directed RNA polymerase specialized sigma24 family protein